MILLERILFGPIIVNSWFRVIFVVISGMECKRPTLHGLGQILRLGRPDCAIVKAIFEREFCWERVYGHRGFFADISESVSTKPYYQSEKALVSQERGQASQEIHWLIKGNVFRGLRGKSCKTSGATSGLLHLVASELLLVNLHVAVKTSGEVNRGFRVTQVSGIPRSSEVEGVSRGKTKPQRATGPERFWEGGKISPPEVRGKVPDGEGHSERDSFLDRSFFWLGFARKERFHTTKLTTSLIEKSATTTGGN